MPANLLGRCVGVLSIASKAKGRDCIDYSMKPTGKKFSVASDISI